MRITYMAGLAWMILASPAIAISIITYDASLGTSVVAPEVQNSHWFTFGIGSGTVAPVVNDLDTGINAWNVTVDKPGATPVYSYGLNPFTEEMARTHGWRLKASARMVDDFNGYGGSGVTAFWDNKAYYVLFGLAPSGALAVTHDGFSNPLALTPPGMGTNGYHDIELRWSPEGSGVEFWFDGQFQHMWPNFPAAGLHANTVQFGHFTTFGLASMNFQSVAYEIGPFFAPPELVGDFNGDGQVDAADYTVWRNSLGKPVTPYSGADADGSGLIDAADLLAWKQNFGTAAAMPGQPLAIPAPASLRLAVAMVAGLLLVHCLVAGRGDGWRVVD